MTEKFEASWYLGLWGFVALGIILIICLLIVFAFSKNEESISVILSTFLSVVILISALGIQNIIENQEKVQWTKEYVIPYIESLPVEKSEIINLLEIDSLTNVNLIFNVNGDLVEYKRPRASDDYGFMKELELKFTLETNGHPYVEYKHLEEPIEWHKSGYYDLVLYLPKDYSWAK